MIRISKFSPVAVAILLFLPSLCFGAQYKVTGVLSGDTIVARAPKEAFIVRLIGIDAPEKGQPYSDRAREYLADLILNKTVFLFNHGTDPEQRILGEIFLKGKSINIEMLQAGLAEVYIEIPPKRLDLIQYLMVEKEAKDAKRGMWALGEQYVSPSLWRMMHHGEY